jgi:uncharacterized protein
MVKPAITKILATLLGFFWLVSAFAAEVIPPKPAKYFNDYAGVVPPAIAAQLNAQLEQFERDAYNQIVVAVFPKMQSESAIEEYTVRVFNAWQIGQKDKRNGAALFVFVQDRKMFIVTGYGLEGALPDAICKDIVEDVIKPHFKAQDYAGGLTAGVNAILAATKGEYHGTGRTAGEHAAGRTGIGAVLVFIIIFLVVMSSLSRSRHAGAIYSNAGWLIGGVLSNLGNRGGGGGSWGGGGGGFSGGGGSSGGGGAGGSW